MNSERIAHEVVDILNELGVAYMVTGSIASNVYAVPRSTKDLDVVIEAADEHVAEVARRLGSRFKVDAQAAFETVTMTPKFVIQHRDSPFLIGLFSLSQDEHDQARFARRRQLEVRSQRIFVPTPEDIIINKLKWHHRSKRPKDYDDARNVLAVQGEALDFAYIESWCGKHGTLDLLNQVRASLPPEL